MGGHRPGAPTRILGFLALLGGVGAIGAACVAPPGDDEFDEFDEAEMALCPGARNPYARIEAESANASQGVTFETTTDTGGGQNAGSIANGDYLRFNAVDFGSPGANNVQARVASGASAGVSGLVEYRLGGVNGTLIGSFSVGSTGGWQSWQTVPANVQASGIHDLYVVFKSGQPADFVNLNWIQFQGSIGSGSCPGATSSSSATTSTSSTSATTGSGGSGGTGGGGGSGGAWTYNPGQAFATTAPPFTNVTHPLQPTGLWGSIGGARPTNASWLNVVLGSGDERIPQWPYTVKAQAQTLGVSLPGRMVAALSITTGADVHVQLGAVETFSGHVLTGHDALSATLRWNASGGSMTTPIVYGAPYVTAQYAGLRPRITTGGPAILSVNGSGSGNVSGTRFEITLNNGQTWLLYATSNITLSVATSGLSATSAYTGALRVALRQSAAAATVLDQHAAAIPTGGSFGASVNGNTATVTYQWTRTGSGTLLTMAMPHHQSRLSGATTTSLTYTTLRGELRGIAGNSWTLSYPLPATDFDAPRAIDASRRAAVESALLADQSFQPDATTVSNDPYFGGKQLAKLARLAVIARAVNRTDITSTLVTRLKPLVNAWLNGTNGNPLRYDSTWGGLITAAGRNDPSADFGMGYYNDHHFHYGYHLYAASVIAREDPAWATTYGGRVMALVRDIMNPSPSDPYFTPFRNFDFYEGHSWAAGLFVFGDARNQESTSEAVNAWYSTALYGQATSNTNLRNLSRVLLAMEIDSTQRYWQVRNADTIYPAPFRDFHAVGVLWGTKVDAVTFFGANPELVYGIQMIPFTPVSEALLNPAWIQDAWPQMASAATSASQGWRGFMYMAHGVIDKNAAWSEASTLSSYDDGNSRTNTLYWLATRP
ncbi:glycosyl hydrolase [Chondromyces crocatus]|uniref:glycosyl hydrolase n=1 Tax=Chondromyces crocatus TaxID=52 RepID=UPI00067BA13B|nr:glycosyl hydrolase [Chondromyces crocatus]